MCSISWPYQQKQSTTDSALIYMPKLIINEGRYKNARTALYKWCDVRNLFIFLCSSITVDPDRIPHQKKETAKYLTVHQSKLVGFRTVRKIRTQWNRALLQTTIVVQLLKVKLTYGIQRFITVFTRTRQWSLS
jgi:hypothetical protein